MALSRNSKIYDMSARRRREIGQRALRKRNCNVAISPQVTVNADLHFTLRASDMLDAFAGRSNLGPIAFGLI